MKRPLLVRGIIILVVALAAAALAYPPKQKINLGLDLRGGMHLLLQVHTEDALRAETDSDLAALLDRAKQQGIANLKAQRTGDSVFTISGATPEQRDALSELAQRYLPRWDVSRQGEDAMVFTMKPSDVNIVRNAAVNQAVTTIDNRINQFGVTEPVIQPTTTGHRILVQLPGVDDPERVRRLIKNTAFLEFRVVDFPKGGGGVGSREEILANFGGQLPQDLEILEGDRRENNAVVGKLYYAVQKRRTVTGRDLSNAQPDRGQFGQPNVAFTLTPTGAQAFGEPTGQNVGKRPRHRARRPGGLGAGDQVAHHRPRDRSRATSRQQEVQDLVDGAEVGRPARRHHLPGGAHGGSGPGPRLDSRRRARRRGGHAPRHPHHAGVLQAVGRQRRGGAGAQRPHPVRRHGHVPVAR